MNITFEFPDIIHITIIDAGTRLPVQNIALLLHLLALKNMDFFFFAPVSDKQGNINVSKRWLTEQIENNSGSLPIENVSGLDDLYPEIEVMTATEDDINKSIEILSNNQIYSENIVQIEELSNSANQFSDQDFRGIEQ